MEWPRHTHRHRFAGYIYPCRFPSRSLSAAAATASTATPTLSFFSSFTFFFKNFESRIYMVMRAIDLWNMLGPGALFLGRSKSNTYPSKCNTLFFLFKEITNFLTYFESLPTSMICPVETKRGQKPSQSFHRIGWRTGSRFFESLLVRRVSGFNVYREYNININIWSVYEIYKYSVLLLLLLDVYVTSHEMGGNIRHPSRRPDPPRSLLSSSSSSASEATRISHPVWPAVAAHQRKKKERKREK